MNPHFTIAAVFLISGLVMLISTRGAANSMANNLATHARRPNRSRWLDPIFSKGQLLVAFRAAAALALLIALYNGIAGVIG